MKLITSWRQQVKRLKVELYSIYLAYRDPRVSWYAKICAIIVVGYAFSPIDLIPDFIPIIGFLDDLIILPLGIILVIKLIPKEIISEYKYKAQVTMEKSKPKNYIAGFIIIIIWTVLLLAVIKIYFN